MQIQRPNTGPGHFQPVTFTWTGPEDRAVGLTIAAGPTDGLVIAPYGESLANGVALDDAKDGAKFLELVNALYDKPSVQIEPGHRYELYTAHWGTNPRSGEYRQFVASSAPAEAVEAAKLGREILARLGATRKLNA